MKSASKLKNTLAVDAPVGMYLWYDFLTKYHHPKYNSVVITYHNRLLASKKP